MFDSLKSKNSKEIVIRKHRPACLLLPESAGPDKVAPVGAKATTNNHLTLNTQVPVNKSQEKAWRGQKGVSQSMHKGSISI